MRPSTIRAGTGYLALGILLASSMPAHAWKDMEGDSSPPYTVWSTLPVSYMLNQNGSADLGGFAPTEAVIQASFGSWEAPACTSWAVAYGGSTSRRPTSGDDQHVLGWTESGWGYESYAIGVTSLMFWSYTAIAEADIDFNGVNFTWNTSGGGGSSVDTQSIATHEMGH